MRGSSQERDALGIWLGSRLALALLSVAGAYQLAGARAGAVLARWNRWDVTLLQKVARFGYTGRPAHYPDVGIEAFFPGFPLVLRAVHTAVPDWTAAGLLVSLVAGGVAVLALARLAGLDGVDGPLAALCLVLSPYAVFLAAGYSESLFLALALPGWLAARSRRWPLAALLVAGACLVRVNGAFLAAGLLVQYATVERRPTREAGWLLAPWLALLAYAAYLHSLTGDWLRWLHAQQQGWGRQLTPPLSALQATWDAARSPNVGAEYAWSFRAEIVAVAVGVAVTGVLLVRRRWGEATYVGLSVASLATSTYYLSIARATLLWFPLWLLLAEACGRRPVLRSAYVVVCAPLMTVVTLTFLAGRWVG